MKTTSVVNNLVECEQEQSQCSDTSLPHRKAKYTACTQQQLLFIIDITVTFSSDWGSVVLGSAHTRNEAVQKRSVRQMEPSVTVMVNSLCNQQAVPEGNSSHPKVAR